MPTLLIIGASSGIGRACALSLAASHSLVLAGRDPTRLATVTAACAGDSHTVLCGDVTDPAVRAAWVADCPPLDGVVYSAGGNTLRPVRFIDGPLVDSMTDVHFKAPLLLLSALLKGRKLNRGAAIVWLSSIAATHGSPGNVVYAGVKAGLMATIRPLALELAPQGLRINAVVPGLVDTPLTDQIFANLPPEARDIERAKHPLGQPTADDVAGVVGFLLSPAAAKITGQAVVVDGGRCAGG
jgi:NAD(P)-dependent dehydrogenase (short-subunit alcohol dehydrogenase family)